MLSPNTSSASTNSDPIEEPKKPALPATGREHARDRRLEPLMLIGDRQAHTIKTALLERAQKLGPERAGLDLPDIQADHLLDPALMDRVGDDDRVRHHPAMVSDLHVLSVQPQIPIGALQRPLAEQLDLLIQAATHR